MSAPLAFDYMRQLEMFARRSTTTLSIHGFETHQSNGQRISINLRFKDQGEEIERVGLNEVFIGHLPRDSFEDELLHQILSAGRVYKIRWMMDFSGNNRGFSFVKYVTREEALNGVRMLDNYCIREGSDLIGAKISKDNKGLYIGNLPELCSCEEFVKALVRFEVQGIVGAIMDDKNNSMSNRTLSFDINNNSNININQINYHNSKFNNNINRGRNNQRYNSRGGHSNRRGGGSKYCFVLFESHAAATKARRILMPSELKFFGRILTIDWARSDISHWDIQSREGFFNCTKSSAIASAAASPATSSIVAANVSSTVSSAATSIDRNNNNNINLVRANNNNANNILSNGINLSNFNPVEQCVRYLNYPNEIQNNQNDNNGGSSSSTSTVNTLQQAAAAAAKFSQIWQDSVWPMMQSQAIHGLLSV